uniref:G-protein alpha subunit n=1 Tax=Wuchereria bancrofti TaxID=6293 RepID=A0AAF5PGK8_WUCBA
MGSRPSLLQCSAPSVQSDDSTSNIAKINILILGTAAVGKTTLFRQLRLCGKCKPLERSFYQSILLQNLVQIYSDIFQACKELNLDISKQREKFDIILANKAVDKLSSNCLRAIKDIPKDSTIQKLIRTCNKLSLVQNIQYFFDNIERITASDYIPTEIDILNSYAPTIGIDQIHYRTSFASISIVDIGGNEYSRRKWDKFYSIINVLLYIVDLTAFCKLRKERLSSVDECVTIFTQLCNNFTLKKSHFIVLFNKKDVFDAQKRPQLNGLPPDGVNTTLSSDATSSLSLIKAKFLSHLTRKIYQHTVSLLYRDTFEASVMDSISEIAAKKGAVTPM